MVVINFGDYIKEQCIARGISRYRLSKISGVPAQTIQNYINGVHPTLEKADRLLQALGATMTIGKHQTERRAEDRLED